MSNRTREIHLTRRPVGRPVSEDFTLAEVELPDPGPGQVLVRNTVLSVDPYMRGRMNDTESYVAPYALNAAMGAVMYHWALHPWAIYGVVALSLAFFAYNKGRPLSIRSGAMAAVGSNRIQPRSGSHTSTQAWASYCRTIRYSSSAPGDPP